MGVHNEVWPVRFLAVGRMEGEGLGFAATWGLGDWYFFKVTNWLSARYPHSGDAITEVSRESSWPLCLGRSGFGCNFL